MRPLSRAASALVFFSRRTDMPFHYTTSLAKLHFPEDAVYEVSPPDTLHSRALPWHTDPPLPRSLCILGGSCLWDEGAAATGSSISLFQVQDVYMGKIIGALKTADNFSVVINPSGVVMWYLRPMALPVKPRNVRQRAPSEVFHPALL